MEIEATVDAGTCPPPPLPLLSRLRSASASILVPLLAGAFVLAALHIHQAAPYTPAAGLGYALGLVGGSLMLALLLYPIRKRLRSLQILGPLKHWFRFHLVAGIVGPICVLFHSTFHIGSFNAAIALYSMLLVVASGIVGRFIYRKIHHGLFGSRASLEELQRTLNQQMEALQPLLADLPAVRREVGRFSELVARQPAGRWHKAAHFLSIGWQRFLIGRRVRSAVTASGHAAHTDLGSLAETLDAALRAAQKAAQFSTYERLFSLWHVVHIPFLWMLLITAIVHVVAVHAY